MFNKCAKTGCTQPISGNSKYCKAHKAEARTAWKAMITAQAEERADRGEMFKDLFFKAHQAGLAAMQVTVPTPELVAEHANVLDDTSPIVKAYVMRGACGFAWVEIGPANCAFANWIKKNSSILPLRVSAGYYGGLTLNVMLGGQSVELKYAYAVAFAAFLDAHKQTLGFKTAYAMSRED